MDPSNGNTGKLRKLSLKNIKNSFTRKSKTHTLHENISRTVEEFAQHQKISEDIDVTDDEGSYTSRQNITFTNIFRSLRKKCIKNTLSTCKSKQKVSTELKLCQNGFSAATVVTHNKGESVHRDVMVTLIPASADDLSPPPLPPKQPAESMSSENFVVTSLPSLRCDLNFHDYLNVESGESHLHLNCDHNAIPPPVPPRIFDDLSETDPSGACPEYLAISSRCKTDESDDGPNRGVQQELSTLARFGWYWGPITRREAEEKLQNQPDGAFLVRDSCSENYLLTLSFRSSGRTLHTRIEHSYGFYTLFSQQGGYPSVAELVQKCMVLSKSAILCYSTPRADMQPGYPVRLTTPVSRFMQVRSLQYLCRFVIRQYISVDDIQRLPIPKPIQGYIEQRHY